MKQLLYGALLGAASLSAWGQQSEEGGTYQPEKLVKSKAENACSLLANVNLPQKDFQAIALHTEPETFGVLAEDREGYHIMVTYPFRVDGVRWACVFRDYRNNSLLQLVEFGLVGGGWDDVTRVKPLW